MKECHDLKTASLFGYRGMVYATVYAVLTNRSIIIVYLIFSSQEF